MSRDQGQDSAGKLVLYAAVGPELIQYDLDIAQATLAQERSIQLPGDVQMASPAPTNSFLYVASSKGSPLARNPVDEHYLTALRIDPSGGLRPFGKSVRLRHRPIHVCLDVPGRHLLTVCSDPADLTVHRITEDGTIGEQVPQIAHPLGVYPHQVVLAPSGDLAVIPARGNSATATRAGDPGGLHSFLYKDGVFVSALGLAGPNGGVGFAPRHLDFHPTKPWVYVSLEAQNELHVYHYDSSGLAREPVFKATTLFGNSSGQRQLAGTIRVHPNGRYVYAANRASDTVELDGKIVFAGGANDIAVFGLDQTNGDLVPLERVDTRGIRPRTFAFDPSGKTLIVANQDSLLIRDGANVRTVFANLAIYRVSDEGKLTFVRKYDVNTQTGSLFWNGIVCVPPSV